MAKTKAAVSEQSAQEPSGFTPVTFRDTAYKSRTLIVAGKPHEVVKSTIVASTPELLDWLEKHPEFQRVE